MRIKKQMVQKKDFLQEEQIGLWVASGREVGCSNT